MTQIKILLFIIILLAFYQCSHDSNITSCNINGTYKGIYTHTFDYSYLEVDTLLDTTLLTGVLEYDDVYLKLEYPLFSNSTEINDCTTNTFTKNDEMIRFSELEYCCGDNADCLVFFSGAELNYNLVGDTLTLWSEVIYPEVINTPIYTKFVLIKE